MTLTNLLMRSQDGDSPAGKGEQKKQKKKKIAHAHDRTRVGRATQPHLFLSRAGKGHKPRPPPTQVTAANHRRRR